MHVTARRVVALRPASGIFRNSVWCWAAFLRPIRCFCWPRLLFVGIVIREFGLRTGAAFYLASVLLGFLTAPNKFYVISFSAMGLYILGTEALYRLMAGWPSGLQKPGYLRRSGTRSST